jgi:hypothetical protein
MTLYLGIDPGRQGAIALLDKCAMNVTCHPMPDTTAGLHDLLSSMPVVKQAILERPFYPQMIGIANAVKIAEAYGILRGALQWLSIPTRDVTPSVWKARMGLTASKDRSREKASEIFPANAYQWRLKKNDGLAEAALIALYGAEVGR